MGIPGLPGSASIEPAAAWHALLQRIIFLLDCPCLHLCSAPVTRALTPVRITRGTRADAPRVSHLLFHIENTV